MGVLEERASWGNIIYKTCWLRVCLLEYQGNLFLFSYERTKKIQGCFFSRNASVKNQCWTFSLGSSMCVHFAAHLWGWGSDAALSADLGMWSIREPSCPEGPNAGYVWEAAGINAAKTGNDFWLDNTRHPWAISTEKTPQLCHQLLHCHRFTDHALPQVPISFFKHCTVQSIMFRNIFGRAEWEEKIHFLLTWWVEFLGCSPLFLYFQRKAAHSLRISLEVSGEYHHQEVWHRSWAASEKELWYNRGSPHLCLENTSIINKIWLNSWSKSDRK